MPRTTTLTYPAKAGLNKVNRYSVRETYSLSTIHEIINSSSVLHISLPPPGNGNPFPICLPMVGVAASFEHPSAGLGEVLDVYVHGYVSGRMMNLTRKAEGEGEEGEGLPVTVSATKVDGLVLSLTPYTHDINYRSATLYGRASLVTSPAEKLFAMTAITNSVLHNRWSHTRVPPTSAELSSTAILKVKVVGGSGKIRVGGPRDEMKDLEMRDDGNRMAEDGDRDGVGKDEGGGVGTGDGRLWREKVWTGVVPVWETLGDAVWGGAGIGEKGETGGEAAPEHVRQFVEETRKRNEEYAYNAIGDKSQD